MVGSNVPWEGVSPLRFTSSGAAKTANWLALVHLPLSKCSGIFGVGNLSQQLIGLAALAVLCVCPSAATG